MNVQIVKAGSPIKSIATKCELHFPNEDSLTVGINNFREINRIVNIAASVGMKLTILFSGVIFTFSASNLAPVERFFNELQRKGLISGNDRYALREQVLIVEKVFRDRLAIVETAPTVAQKDILVDVASPYIDGLLDNTEAYEDIVPLLFYSQGRWENPNVPSWREWLGSRHPKDLSTCIECMEHLSTMMQGRMDMSSAFTQTGIGIPTLDHQRDVLINAIKKAFEVKYGSTRKDAFEAFYIDLALEKISRNIHVFKYISHLYKIPVNSAFPKLATKKRICLADNGSSYRVEFDILPDAIEIEMLKKYGLRRFPKSLEDFSAAMATKPGEVIKDKLTLLKLIDGEAYAGMSPKEQLCCAIEDDARDEVVRIISTFSFDLNQALFDAVTHGSLAVAKALIDLGAIEFSKLRGGEGSTCLHEAAYHKNLAMIRLLLESGAVSCANFFGLLPLHALFCRVNNPKITVLEMKEIITLLMPTKSFADLQNLLFKGKNCFQLAQENKCEVGLLALLEIAGSSIQVPSQVAVKSKNGD